MKTLELNQLEIINGGSVSGVVTGACASIGLAGALKLITISRTAGIGLAVVCGANAAGSHYGWW